MSVSRIHTPSSAMRRGASLAGTCLMQTAIFMFASALGPAFEEQSGIGAAEPERIRQCVLDIGLARLVGHVIEVARRVGMVVVDGGRQDLIAQGEHAYACLETAGTPEQVTGHGLRRTDRELLGVVAKDALQ